MSSLRVTICYAAEGIDAREEMVLSLGAAATLGDAISAARQRPAWAEIDVAAVGIWGRVKPLATLLRDGDRVEIYRPLKADPKAARRHRAVGRASRKM